MRGKAPRWSRRGGGVASFLGRTRPLTRLIWRVVPAPSRYTGRGLHRSGLILALLLLPLSTFAAEVDCQAPRPAWCAPGFSCVPSACLASLRVERDDALADLAAARVRSRRFHADLTCGAGIATALDKDFGLSTFPTPGACVVGLAIRIGK